MNSEVTPLADARLDHTGWFTPDIERSARFWTEILGFTPGPIQERRLPWLGKLMGIPVARARIVHLFGHGGHIEFIQLDEPPGLLSSAGPHHFEGHVCFRLKDVASVRDRILAAGGQSQGELTDISEGTARGLRGMYIRDPHGVLIELIEDTPT